MMNLNFKMIEKYGKDGLFSGKCCAEDFLLEKDCFLAENGNRNGRENNGRKSGWLRTCLFFCVGLSIVRQCEERNGWGGQCWLSKTDIFN